MVGNIGAPDGNKFSVNIGQFPAAQAFKKAVADKDTPRAAALLKNLIMMEAMKTMTTHQPLSSIKDTPIIQMMNDPDWSPKEIATLLAETLKSGDVRTSGNALFALGELNGTRADKIKTALLDILGKNSKLPEKLQQHITGVAGLEKALAAGKPPKPA